MGVAQLMINLVFSFNSNMLMATNIFSTDLLNKLTKERREGGGGQCGGMWAMWGEVRATLLLDVRPKAK